MTSYQKLKQTNQKLRQDIYELVMHLDSKDYEAKKRALETYYIWRHRFEEEIAMIFGNKALEQYKETKGLLGFIIGIEK